MQREGGGSNLPECPMSNGTLHNLKPCNIVDNCDVEKCDIVPISTPVTNPTDWQNCTREIKIRKSKIEFIQNDNIQRLTYREYGCPGIQ